MPEAYARIALTVAAGLAAWGAGFVVLGLCWNTSLLPLMLPKGIGLVVTGVLIAACCAIWLRLVAWTRTRASGTAAISVLLLVHVLLWPPLFNVQGCGSSDALVQSQCEALTGIWWVGCGLLWWSRGRRRRALEELHVSGRHDMSPSATRLALSLARIPFLAGLGSILQTGAQQFSGLNPTAAALVSAGTCTAVLIAATLALWRTRVVWTRRRIRGTAILAAVALVSQASPLLDQAGSLVASSGLWEALTAAAGYSLPFFGWAAWVGGAAWLWRYGPGELPPHAKSALLDVPALSRCPACRYSLVGLHELRCPECGWRASVDRFLEVKLCEALDVS